jgi:hypothetical protein
MCQCGGGAEREGPLCRRPAAKSVNVRLLYYWQIQSGIEKADANSG